MRPLRAAVARALTQEGYPNCEVCVVLTDDHEVHNLNHEFRGMDRPTDVLSFGLLDNPSPRGGNPLRECVALGDVVVSIDSARRQAPGYNRTFQQEVELLAVHGALHLAGYDDESDEGAELMRQRETLALTPPRGQEETDTP